MTSDWQGPGQRHLYRTAATERGRIVPAPAARSTELTVACPHEWAAAPIGIACRRCGTPWDKRQPDYLKRSVLVRS